MSASNQESYNRYKKYSTDLRRYYRLPAIQTSLSIVLSLFVSAFFILVAIRPTLVTIAKLNKTITESEKTLTQLNAKATTLQQISTVWETLTPYQKFIDNTIPPDGPRYQELAKSIEVLAAENGTTVSSMTIGEAVTYSTIADLYSGKNKTVVSTPFTLLVQGDYTQTRDFLTKLTAIDRLITIDSLSFAKGVQTGTDAPPISFTLTGSVTYLADESQLSTILGTKGEAHGSQDSSNDL